MDFKCPGAKDFNQAKPELITCPFCSFDEVEIWTDEIKATCAKCKRTLIRDLGASCLDWCKYAKKCVGEQVYNKYLEQKKKK